MEDERSGGLELNPLQSSTGSSIRFAGSQTLESKKLARDCVSFRFRVLYCLTRDAWIHKEPMDLGFLAYTPCSRGAKSQSIVSSCIIHTGLILCQIKLKASVSDAEAGIMKAIMILIAVKVNSRQFFFQRHRQIISTRQGKSIAKVTLKVPRAPPSAPF